VGLAIVDLADPRDPVLVGSVLAGGQPADLDARGNVLFVTGEAGDLVAMDISIPERPYSLGTLVLPGAPQSVRVLGNYLLVPAGAEGLLVIEASNPAKMRLVGQFKPGGFAEFVAIKGGRAYLANGQGGLVVLDVGNPEQPQELGRLPVAPRDYCWSVELAGDIAYVGTMTSGVFMVDVSDPAIPKLGRQIEGGSVRAVRVRDGLAYLLSVSTLTVYNVSDVSSPTLARLPVLLFENSENFELAGDYAYVAGSTRLIVVQVGGRVGQEITHTLPSSVSYSPAPLPLSAQSSSGLPVQWHRVTGPKPGRLGWSPQSCGPPFTLIRPCKPWRMNRCQN
jgi:hypothetical protein